MTADIREDTTVEMNSKQHPPRPIPALRQPIASTTLPTVRSKMWRELPASCRRLFLDITIPMFEKYKQCSQASKYKTCAVILHGLLDLPAITLLKGSRKQLRQTLQQQHHVTMQHLMGIHNDDEDSGGPIAASTDNSDPVTQELSATAAIPSNNAQVPHADTEVHPLDEAASIQEASDSTDETTQSGDSDEETMIIRANRRAVAIVTEGGKRCLSRAAKTLMQSPLAEINKESMSKLRQLHPTATQGMQHIPSGKGVELTAIDPQMLLLIIKRRINNGSAPGPSGWTGSHLQLIAQCKSAEAREGLCLLIRDIANGIFGGHTQQRLLASVLTPISKPGGGVRPIAMGEVMVKLAAHYLMALIEDKLPSLFPRIQYGVKRAGGSESAAQLIR